MALQPGRVEHGVTGELTTPEVWSRTNTKVLQVLANVLAGQNRETKAAHLLEFALAREPDNAELMKALCGVYLMLERYPDALDMAERYLKAEEAGPGRAPVLMVKALALWGQGLTSDAAATFNEYLALRSKS